MLRFYLNRHVRKMFDGSQLPTTQRVLAVEPPRAREGALRAAQAAFAKAQRPLMVIGSQAVVLSAQADALAAAVAELGVPVYLSGMARGLLGRDHPLQMRHQRRQALREADCVLLAGVPVRLPARLRPPRAAQRDADRGQPQRQGRAAEPQARHRRHRRRRPVPAGAGEIHADTGPRWSDWLAQLRTRDEAREAEIDQQGAVAGEHVNPIAFLRALEKAAGDNALLVADGGDFVATASYVLHPRGPLTWLDPGAFGTLGVGAGFALGAALARPSAEVWIVFGDGACGYGLAEFDTFVRHGIPVIAVVGNDAGWTQIAREQVKMLHDDVATVLARSDYHVVAGFGARAAGQDTWRRSARAGAGPRVRAAGQAGAGERLARQDRVSRRLAVDVADTSMRREHDQADRAHADQHDNDREHEPARIAAPQPKA